MFTSRTTPIAFLRTLHWMNQQSYGTAKYAASMRLNGSQSYDERSLTSAVPSIRQGPAQICDGRRGAINKVKRWTLKYAATCMCKGVGAFFTHTDTIMAGGDWSPMMTKQARHCDT